MASHSPQQATLGGLDAAAFCKEPPDGWMNVDRQRVPAYTPEQQVRLRVDWQGNPAITDPRLKEGPCGVDCGKDGACGLSDVCGLESSGRSVQPTPILSFVGNGRGEFVKDTTYTYVGYGVGDHGRPSTRGTSSWNWCYFCGALGALASIAAFVAVFFWPIGTTTTSTTTWVPDCSVGQESTWSMSKRASCCERLDKGCFKPESKPRARAPPPPPQVTAAPVGYCNEGGVDQWSAEKKVYCCKHFNNGCGTPEPAPVAPPVIAVATYDCEAGFSDWAAGWSVSKKEWCCKNAGRGCSTGGGREDAAPTGTVVAQPTAQYNCVADFGTWETSWSQEKKVWCCEKQGRGCQVTA